MDPQQFDDSLTDATADMLSTMYAYGEMPRSRVDDIHTIIQKFVRHPSIIQLHNSLIESVESAGDANVEAYKVMLQKMENPFHGLETE